MAAVSKPLPVPPSVLVGEDEILLRLAVTDELRDRGVDVVEAANADEAVALLRTPVQVDVLFTDVRMPGSMDGIALAKILRRLRPGLRVIVASGQLPEECCESTIDMFFRKPYDLTLVAEFIKTLLASRD